MAKPLSEIAANIPNAAVPSGGLGLVLTDEGRVPSETLKVAILSADPASPFEGQVWIRSDTNQLRWREGGTTYQVTGTAV